MVENSSSCKGRRVVGPTKRRKREETEAEAEGEGEDAVDESGDLTECSGRYCRSCTAVVIADCVALCCCPCALLNLLTLALVKVPWKMGRRCLGFGKNKRKKRKRKRVEMEMERKCEKTRESSTVFGEEEILEDDEGEKQEKGNFSARFEAEKVWLELYQVGHLGFGRVSFSGT